MHHGSKQPVCRVMTGDIENRDARLPFASFKLADDFRSAFGRSLPNPRVEVKAFLEIHVNDVIAPDASVERNASAIDIDTSQRGDLPRRRHDVLCDFLKILQFAQQALDRIRIPFRHLQFVASALLHLDPRYIARVPADLKAAADRQKYGLHVGPGPHVSTISRRVRPCALRVGHIVGNNKRPRIQTRVEEVETWNVQILPQVEENKVYICFELGERLYRVAEPELDDLGQVSPLQSFARVSLFVLVKLQGDHTATGVSGRLSQPHGGVSVRRADLKNDFRFGFLNEQVDELTRGRAYREQELVAFDYKVVRLELLPSFLFGNRADFVLVEYLLHRGIHLWHCDPPRKPYCLIG